MRKYGGSGAPLPGLAKAYAFGIGVEKDTQIAKLLFAGGLDNDSEVYSAHSYACSRNLVCSVLFGGGRKQDLEPLVEETECGRQISGKGLTF